MKTDKSQSFITQTKRDGKLVANIPAIEENSKIMVDEKTEESTEKYIKE